MILHLPRETNCLVGRIPLIGIGNQGEVVTRCLASFDKSLCVDLGTAATHFKLHASYLGLLRGLHLFGDWDIGVVVAPGPDNLNPIAIPTPQSPQRLLYSLAYGIPDCTVYRGTGYEADSAITEDVPCSRPRQLPTPFYGKCIFSNQVRSDLIADNTFDLIIDMILVADERLSNDVIW